MRSYFLSDVIGDIFLLDVDCHGGILDVDWFRSGSIFAYYFIGQYVESFHHGELVLSLLLALMSSDMSHVYVVRYIFLDC